MKIRSGVKSMFIMVLAALVVSGCNQFENPNGADSAATDNGTDTMQMDAGNSADVGTDISSPDIGQPGTDISSPDVAQPQDLGNTQDTATAPDVQAVEVAQQASAVDAGPKPECTKDTDCNDSNPCTVDVCGNGAVCVHVATPATCDDGNACTDNDLCVNGACKGSAKNCDDSNLCTDDFCVAGNCVHGVNTAPCDDGNVCTKIDYCQGGSCQSGEWLTCEDNNPCTYDNCVNGQGCVNGLVTCDDNNPCTTDSCDTKSGNCQNAQKVCDDGKVYTYDWCDASGWYDGQPGQCIHENKWDACTKDSDCEDGNACTIDVCDGLEGTCKWVSKNCNDYDACTIDSCVPAKGCAVMLISCDDNDPSTADSCNKYGSCVHTPIASQPTPTIPPTLAKIEISCGAVACEPHLYFGQQKDGTVFDVYGKALANSSTTIEVSKSQLAVWGLEVAVRLTTGVWPWFGCDVGTPGLETVVVKIDGVVQPGVLVKHMWVCGGGGQGNLAWPLTLFK